MNIIDNLIDIPVLNKRLLIEPKFSNNSDNSNLNLTDIVFVYNNGKAEVRKVETDFRNDTAVQVTSGLNENDTVITSGIMQMRPGVGVKLTNLK